MLPPDSSGGLRGVNLASSATACKIEDKRHKGKHIMEVWQAIHSKRA